jgi:ABC-type oligopeptide transport system ATPase subunit
VEDAGNRSTIVDNISFTVEPGKFLVITGPNGGGKSTMAKIIMGIEKPTSGQIFLTASISQTKALRNAQEWGSDTDFSIRRDSKDSLSIHFFLLHTVRNCLRGSAAIT